MNVSKLLFLFLFSVNQSWAKIENDAIVLNDKVTICHFPPGNISNVQKITISSNALKTHIDHHDDYILTSTEECKKKSFLICHDGVDEMISKNQWKKDNNFKNYYLGSCNSNATFYPLPNPENFIPLPETKVKEFVKLTDVSYCDDGGKKSDVDIFDATIKRANVSNAFVSDAVIGNIQPNIIKYGVLSSNSGITDLANGTVDYNKVTGVDLQNVEITNLFLDTEHDYIDSNGNVIDGTYISISGGLLNEKVSFSEKNIVYPTITSGVIVSGHNINKDPVRGSLLNGKIEQPKQLESTVLTKVRRLRGSIKNANITNATVIMLNGQAVVTSGHLLSGIFFGENTSFGTTINTTFFKINIHEVNHCFSSGTVGSRGQLNWKEVVK